MNAVLPVAAEFERLFDVKDLLAMSAAGLSHRRGVALRDLAPRLASARRKA